MALGSTTDLVEINIAGNSESSSLLQMEERHHRAAPDSAIIGTEKVQVKPLDEVLPDLRGDAQNIYMKCDTQGFELEVLKGAKASLSALRLIQLELSSEELYAGAPLIGDVYVRQQLHDGRYQGGLCRPENRSDASGRWPFSQHSGLNRRKRQALDGTFVQG